MNRRTQMYGLFEVTRSPEGKKVYTRLYPGLAYSLSSARRIFQNSLLQYGLNPEVKNPRELRPVGHVTGGSK